MGLVLKLKENDVVYVDNKPVRVIEIITPQHFKLRVEEEFMSHEFTITDARSTEIMPTVVVSAGEHGEHGSVKAVFKAPRQVEIFRESLWKERQNGIHGNK